jgi:hypothetical protein
LTVEEIASLPVQKILKPTAHPYLWVPNALLPDGIRVLQAWGFEYKSNIVFALRLRQKAIGLARRHLPIRRYEHGSLRSRSSPRATMLGWRRFRGLALELTGKPP